MSDVDALPAGIAELLAEREIRRLHGRYAQLCDSGYPPDEIAELFVPDGVWEARPDVGIHRGRDAIRAHFANAHESYPWALHVNVPVQIDVAPDLRSAHGVWYLLMPCVTATGPARAGAWLAGRYDNDLVRVDGGWKYAHLRVTFGLMTSHHRDWAADRLELLRQSAGEQ